MMEACFGPYGGPIEPGIAVGGLPVGPDGNKSTNYRLATGVVITFLVNNHNDADQNDPAMEWEKQYISLMKNYENDLLDVAYSAERSIQDAIVELSEGETLTVVISYLVMFLYIAIALGKIRSLRYFFMESKIVLAIGGIFIVLASVICSLGFWGYIGLTTTMLAIEVIPFLVLAIGVDNIFIMVHTYHRLDRDSFESIADCIGEAIGQVGPSILQTAASEIACFAIGSLSDMPAVNTFATYAAVAVFIDFVLQISAFVAMMVIDEKRFENNRLDLLCCFRSSTFKNDSEYDTSLLQKMFTKYYTPFVLSKHMRPIIIIIFTCWSCFSLIVAPSIEPGLDQELSMPKDSHVVKYFQYMADILSMGAPVYWVIKPGLDYHKPEDQNLVCGGVECNTDSISTQLYIMSNYPEM